MKKVISCFMIGHRETTDEILPELVQVIERHVEDKQVGEFIVGSYGGFDHVAAKAVAAVKARYPHIRLLMLLPYHPTNQRAELADCFDGSWYPAGMESVPPRVAIVRANRYAIEHVDYLIAYVWHAASNARNALEYAQKRAQSHGLYITLVGHGNQS